jgi:hypothetical protein
MLVAYVYIVFILQVAQSLSLEFARMTREGTEDKSIQIREYQLEVLRASLRHNTIVAVIYEKPLVFP